MNIQAYTSGRFLNENVRLRIENERVHFLEHVSNQLVSSFDLNKTLNTVSKFIVPYFADFCNTVIADEKGRITDLIPVQKDPRKEKLIREIFRHFEKKPATLGPQSVIQTGKPELMHDKEFLKRLKKTHPRVYGIARELKVISYIGVPLIVKNKVRGALTFSSTRVHYSEDELVFAQALAQRISRALENSLLYADAQKKIIEHKNRELHLIKESEKRWSFLARASKILASSLDYQTTLKNVAHLAVPEIADWCMVDLKDESGGMRAPMIVHSDPEKVAYGFRFRTKIAPNLRKEEPIMQVVRTGKPLYVPLVDDAYMAAFAKDEEEFEIIKDMEFTSIMILPLLVRGKPIGAITLGTSRDRPRYKKTDMPMVEEMASRASLAIENATLHQRSKKAITMRDDFMSIASHELRTPITSVKMYAQFLKRLYEKTSEKGLLDYFEKMDTQVNKMSSLISDLLDVSRIEHGNLDVSMAPFSLDSVVETTVRQAVQITAKSYRISIEGKIGRNVYGDKRLISQVLANMLNNAIRYSPDTDSVVVHLLARKDRALVAIQDFGVGIEKKNQKKIFDPFYRVFDIEKEAKTTPGMGIGLYVSNEIIKKHGSEILVDSKKGKGSTFSFTLPYA